MAWSPLAGGDILSPKDERGERVFNVLKEIAIELNLNADQLDQVVYAWLLKHPVQISPIIGSGKTKRLESAVEALSIDMSLEQWYRIYVASLGQNVP